MRNSIAPTHGALARLLLLFAFVFGLALAGPADAASVRPLGLDEIIDSATTAFQGTCTGNRTELDPQTNMVVTYTTFSVQDVLKGNVLATHTIKQIGGKLPNNAANFKVDGIPNFVVGQSYVVFLAGVSAAGFSSPIGLEQGRFDVRQDKAGLSVTVGRAPREGGAGASTLLGPGARVPSGRVDLDQFKQAVRARVGSGK